MLLLLSIARTRVETVAGWHGSPSTSASAAVTATSIACVSLCWIEAGLLHLADKHSMQLLIINRC